MMKYLKKIKYAGVRYIVSLLVIMWLCPLINASASMNFNEISLKEFVDFVSEYTHKNIIYTAGDLKGTVSIRIRDNISKPDLINILHNIITLYKLEVVAERDVLYIVKDPSVSEFNYQFEKKIDSNEDMGVVVSVYQLDNIDIKELQTFLTSMKSPSGQFAVITSLNTVIIKDRKSNVSKVFQLFDDLTKMAKNYNIEIIPVKNINVKNLANTINDFFKERQRTNPMNGGAVVIPNVDSNSLIVSASNADMDLIKEIIKSHDNNQGIMSSKNVFKLKYANAKDVENILNSIFFNKQQTQTPGTPPKPPDQGGVQIASPITSDKSTNSIIISGDKEFYNQVGALVKELDIERNQVCVEALIMEVTLDKASKFGVEWTAIASTGNNSGVGAASTNSGNLSSMLTATPGAGSVPSGLSVGYLSTIKFGNTTFPTFGALINALKSESGINILSKPLLLSLDNEEADVFVGENRPFMTSEKFDLNNNPIQTYDYRDVGIKLKILPHIVDPETVLLKVNQEIKTVEAVVNSNIAAPITLTRSTNTTIKTKNNMTIVISGLITDTETISKTKIPILGDIPLLGQLFRSQNKSTEKTNLMIFITATILNNSQSIDDITKEKYRLFNEQMGEADYNKRYNIKNQSSQPAQPSIEKAPVTKTQEEQKKTIPSEVNPPPTVPEKTAPEK